MAFFINMADVRMVRVVHYKGYGTRASQLLPQSWGNPYPWLDPDLMGLIAECLYADWQHRPTLQQALERASDAVLNKTADSFPEPEEETDDAISRFVQQFVLDCLRILTWAKQIDIIGIFSIALRHGELSKCTRYRAIYTLDSRAYVLPQRAICSSLQYIPKYISRRPIWPVCPINFRA